MRAIFHQIDKNGNGMIEMGEMVAGINKFSQLGVTKLTSKDAKELFEAIDVDQSG